MSVALQSSKLWPDERATQSTVLLQDTFEALQLAVAQSVSSQEEIDEAFRLCSIAKPEGDFLFRTYYEIGLLALDNERLDFAEEFAIRSLKSLPRYGAAFKLLGLALRAAGRLKEAAICHRYGLPEAVRRKWFGNTPCVMVEVDQINDGSVLRRAAFPGASIQLKPPGQWRPQRIVEFSKETLNVLPAQTYAVADGALWFDTFNTVLWDANGRIIREACRGYAEIVHYSLEGREPLHLGGRVALLGNRNVENYYHWMNDTLPRLAVLEKSGYDLDTIDKFVVSRLKHSFQTESLQALGITADRLHYINGDEYVSGAEVLVPSYGSNTLGMAQGRWNPDFLSRVFTPACKPEQTLRLYISRGSTGARGISNEPELITLLKSYNFQVVHAESMSLPQQAALYSAASVVLGPHGAGFSNIAFCQPGTRVIELFNAHIAPCFWAISEVLGLRHYVHFCGEFDEIARPSDPEEYHRSADTRRISPFSVNLSEIENVLEFAKID